MIDLERGRPGVVSGDGRVDQESGEAPAGASNAGALGRVAIALFLASALEIGAGIVTRFHMTMPGLLFKGFLAGVVLVAGLSARGKKNMASTLVFIVSLVLVLIQAWSLLRAVGLGYLWLGFYFFPTGATQVLVLVTALCALKKLFKFIGISRG